MSPECIGLHLPRALVFRYPLRDVHDVYIQSQTTFLPVLPTLDVFMSLGQFFLEILSMRMFLYSTDMPFPHINILFCYFAVTEVSGILNRIQLFDKLIVQHKSVTVNAEYFIDIRCKWTLYSCT